MRVHSIAELLTYFLLLDSAYYLLLQFAQECTIRFPNHREGKGREHRQCQGVTSGEQT